MIVTDDKALHLHCPKCGKKCEKEGFYVRTQSCVCGWWRDAPKPKKKFLITAPVEGFATLEVEADDWEIAIEIALESDYTKWKIDKNTQFIGMVEDDWRVECIK